MKWLNRIYYIGMFVLALVLITGTDLFSAELGLNALKDATFYIKQAIVYIAVICVTFGTVYSYIDSFKEKNDEYKLADKAILDFAQGKKYVPTILGRYLEDLNRKRKIAQYRFNLQKKLHLLETYHPWWTFKKKYTDEDIHIWNKGTPEEKSKNEYCRKRMLLEEQLDPEYIEKNIDNMHVKYKRISESIILGGYYEDEEKNGPNEYVTKNLGGKILAYKLPKIIMSFGWTFMLSMIIFDLTNFNVNAIMSITTKLGTLAWNAYTATRYAKQLTETTIIKDIRFRKGIVTEYEKWLDQEAERQKEEQKKIESNVNIVVVEEEHNGNATGIGINN